MIWFASLGVGVGERRGKTFFYFIAYYVLCFGRCYVAIVYKFLQLFAEWKEVVKIEISKPMYQQHINKLFHSSFGIYKIISSNKLIETIHACNRKFLSRCLALFYFFRGVTASVMCRKGFFSDICNSRKYFTADIYLLSTFVESFLTLTEKYPLNNEINKIN